MIHLKKLQFFYSQHNYSKVNVSYSWTEKAEWMSFTSRSLEQRSYLMIGTHMGVIMHGDFSYYLKKFRHLIAWKLKSLSGCCPDVGTFRYAGVMRIPRSLKGPPFFLCFRTIGQFLSFPLYPKYLSLSAKHFFHSFDKRNLLPQIPFRFHKDLDSYPRCSFLAWGRNGV